MSDWHRRLTSDERKELARLDADLADAHYVAKSLSAQRRVLVDRVRKRLRTPIDAARLSA